MLLVLYKTSQDLPKRALLSPAFMAEILNNANYACVTQPSAWSACMFPQLIQLPPSHALTHVMVRNVSVRSAIRIRLLGCPHLWKVGCASVVVGDSNGEVQV